jgi:hypothetical protein
MQLYSGDKRYEEVFRLAAMDPGGAGRVVKINPWLAGPYYTVSLVRDTPESLQGEPLHSGMPRMVLWGRDRRRNFMF